jgi:DNA-binding IscR family transcriptional regulator
MSMLQQLADAIHAGGTLETHELARRLGTSPQLVEAMLEHLQSSGLIRSYTNCGDGCGGCSLRDACSTAASSAPRLWQAVSPKS